MPLIVRSSPSALVVAAVLLLGPAAQAKDFDTIHFDAGDHATAAFAVSGTPMSSALVPTPFDAVGLTVVIDEHRVGLVASASSDPGEMSPLPTPATWAMLLAGFGAAGAVLRRGQIYRLVERAADGSTQSEEFHAPDDHSAIERALSVAEGVALELWRGNRLVERLDVPVRAAD